MHRWLINVREDYAMSKDLREICATLARELELVFEGTIIPADICRRLWYLFRRLVCAAAPSERSGHGSCGHGELLDEFSSFHGIASRALGGVERLISDFQ
ncbi:hypothetical protein ASC71_20685 [Rhizobium sp. Root1240]|nr:hypothetical protein ASC71_20685 [Rhizobium sp. Root1240]